jgi:hypothetical protein
VDAKGGSKRVGTLFVNERKTLTSK